MKKKINKVKIISFLEKKFKEINFNKKNFTFSNVDSLKKLNIILEIEREFNIRINIAKFYEIKKIEDIFK